MASSTAPSSSIALRSGSRTTVLIGAIIVQLILGTVYGYSIFWEPLQAAVFPEVITSAAAAELTAAGTDITEYAVVANSTEVSHRLSQQQGYLKYAFSICILSFAVTMVIAGRVQDVRGPRFTAMIGAGLMGGGFLLAGFLRSPFVFYLAHAAFVGAVALLLLMVYEAVLSGLDRQRFPVIKYVPQAIIVTCVTAGILLGQKYVGNLGELDSLFMLWGTIGFLAGAGIGFAYVCPIAALVKWFPDQKGLVSGIAVAGFGFGAYLFKGQTAGALGFIREHDIIPFFMVHGVICLVGISIGAMLLRNPPGTAPAPASGDSTWSETLRRPAFYILWLMFFSGAMAGLMVIGIVKVFAGEQLVAAAVEGGRVLAETETSSLMLTGAQAVGWLAIFNAIGRVVWGFVSDRVGRSPALVAMFLLQAITMFLLARVNTEVTIAVAASVVGFNFGGNFALFPSATADLFGAKNLGANYGWVFTSYGVAGVVGIAAGNAAKSATDSYQAAFMISAVLCLISAGLAVVLHVNTRKAAAV